MLLRFCRVVFFFEGAKEKSVGRSCQRLEREGVENKEREGKAQNPMS